MLDRVLVLFLFGWLVTFVLYEIVALIFVHYAHLFVVCVCVWNLVEWK